MEKSVKHVSIPVFVVHEGCPNTCLFCNQKKISGKSTFSLDESRREIEAHLATLQGGEQVQIAFFGGSFTAIERDKMMALLSLSDEYVEKGLVESVRLSTRPDAIDTEILDILKEHHVQNIELGVQSLDDSVLLKNSRGHTADRARRAMCDVVERGFVLTGQMMTGMYGADPESEEKTAREIIACGAREARIYPTVVFRQTGLARLFEKGEYTPLSLEESVLRTERVYSLFKKSGVKVLRIGLCSTDGVRGDDALSTYHEAIGELVLAKHAFFKLENALERLHFKKGDRIKIYVPTREISRNVGYKKENKTALEKKYGVTLVFEGREEFGMEVL